MELSHRAHTNLSEVLRKGSERVIFNSIEVEGAVFLQVRTGDLFVRIWVAVVTRLAVSVLLETSFVDHVIKESFPRERNVVLDNSCPVAILSTFKMAENVIKEASQDDTGVANTTDHEILFRT